jgi:hypothetical protein
MRRDPSMPKPLECSCETAQPRIGSCPQCEPPEGMEVFTVQQPSLTAAFVLDL